MQAVMALHQMRGPGIEAEDGHPRRRTSRVARMFEGNEFSSHQTIPIFPDSSLIVQRELGAGLLRNDWRALPLCR